MCRVVRSVLSVLLAFAAAMAIVVAVGSRGPSFGEFQQLLAERAGRDARDCGVVKLGDPKAAAVACVETALQGHTGLVVAFQVQSIDSDIFKGLAVTSGGAATRFQWDSDAYAGGGRGVFVRRWIGEQRCPQPRVTDTDAPIRC